MAGGCFGARCPACRNNPSVQGDLLASVRYYLEHECDLSVMKVSELYARLRRMLTEVGLEHLARELREEMPPMTVCVAEIARSVPFWLFLPAN